MGAPRLQLSLDTHPAGRSKARLLKHLGYTRANAKDLETALFEIATNGVLWGTVSVEQGIKYIVDGNLHTTTGRKVPFRTVWIVEQDTPPRLVTAYPLK